MTKMEQLLTELSVVSALQSINEELPDEIRDDVNVFIATVANKARVMIEQNCMVSQ